MNETERTLTWQEREATHVARFDLGPGYPEISVPTNLKAIYNNTYQYSLELGGNCSDSRSGAPSQRDRLSNSLRTLLRLGNSSSTFIYETFSGSLALDRALASIQMLATAKGQHHTIVITTTPSIDIIPRMLSERSHITALFVPSNAGGVLGRLDVSALITSLESAVVDFPKAHKVIMLSSPENPTGEIWAKRELELIFERCVKYDVTVVIDHCFVLAGIHERDEVACVWDIAPPDCRWIAVWDTGKTLGLGHDKLGFLISGSEEIAPLIQSSLDVIQFSMPQRTMAFFAEALDQPSMFDYVQQLRSVCKQNLAALDSSLDGIVKRYPTSGGSLALLDISYLGGTDEEVRSMLLRSGVGVIAANVFFHTEWKSKHMIRVALARDPQMFRGAILAMRDTMASIRS